MKLSRTLTFAALILSLATLAVACHPRGGHRANAEITPQTMERRAIERAGWMLDDIDATDAQRAQINALIKGMVPKAHALRTERRTIGLQLADELLSGKPDAAKVHAMLDAIGDPMLAMVHEAADTVIQAHAILTPKQREALIDRLPPERERFTGSWMLDRGVEHALDTIDASDAQDALVLERKDAIVERVGKLHDTRVSMRALLIEQTRAANPDKAKIHAQLDGAAATLRAFVHSVGDDAVTVARTLTPKQRAMIQARLKERMARGR